MSREPRDLGLGLGVGCPLSSALQTRPERQPESAIEALRVRASSSQSTRGL